MPSPVAHVALPRLDDECGSVQKWTRHDDDTLDVWLREEAPGVFAHWFDVTVVLRPGQEALVLRIVTAGNSWFPAGWKDYRPFVRTKDVGQWVRSSSAFDLSGRLVLSDFSGARELRVAWYAPFDLERLAQFCDGSPALGELLVPERAGRLAISLPGESSGTILLIGRQHPGESMASFFVEGALAEIVSLRTRRLTYLVFPVLGARGLATGRHRTLREGTDLNRSWVDSGETPEVVEVLKAVQDASSVRLVLDVHGDEVSKLSYIRRPNFRGLSSQHRDLDGFLTDAGKFVAILDKVSTFRGLARKALRRPWRLLSKDGYETTAEGYFCRTKRLPAVTLELAAHQLAPDDCLVLGRRFVQAIETRFDE